MSINTPESQFDYKAFRREWDGLLEQHKYKDAEKLCHEGLAKQPTEQARGRLYNHLGYLYENFLDDKTFDDILEHYVLSLQVDESNANSHFNLANFLLEQGMQHLLRALELNPSHHKANKRYATLTPIKMHTSLDLAGVKYQVTEVVEDGVRAVKLKKRGDGTFERSSDEEPVYIEVGSPENVQNGSMGSGGMSGGGRTQNMADKQSPAALNIDSDGYNGNNSRADNAGCCYRCVYYWWLWCLLWLLALAGVAAPVLHYFNLLDSFASTECVDRYSLTEDAVFASGSALNALFVVDCDASDFDKQLTSADEVMSQLTTTGDVDVSYVVLQYCGGQALNVDGNATFTAYTTDDDPLALTALTSNGDDSISDALSACQDVYDGMEEDDIPFLCMPFVSRVFDDTFEAFEIASDAAFANIYLSFMVDEEDTDYSSLLYGVLGSFATGTECINRMEDDGVYDDTWWNAKFNCNADSAAEAETHALCPHCISYATQDKQDCAIAELVTVFGGEGVMQRQLTDKEEECTHEWELYFFYSLGGVGPLLCWVFVVVGVLCCHTCRKGKNQGDMGNGGDQKQTAFV